MSSKHFLDIVEKMKEIHERKNHDYASIEDPFSNFTRAANIVQWFKNPIDQVFAGIIGIKLARLAELSNGKEAKNESINDTFIDSANYFALWGAYYLSLADKCTDSSLPIEGPINYTKYHCIKCHFLTNLKEVLIKHARDMHAARFIECENRLQFNDTFINFID